MRVGKGMNRTSHPVHQGTGGGGGGDQTERCRRTFAAALRCLDSRVSYPNMFVRELAMTAGCDGMYNLSRLRHVFEEDMGADTMKRVVRYQETHVDNRRATQVVYRHAEWARNQLRQATLATSYRDPFSIEGSFLTI